MARISAPPASLDSYSLNRAALMEGWAKLPKHSWSASQWTAALEGWPGAPGPQRVPGVAMEKAVAMALVCGAQPRQPLLRWCLRWRHSQPQQTAQQLIAGGVSPGPELGQRLRSLRAQSIEAGEGPVTRPLPPPGIKI